MTTPAEVALRALADALDAGMSPQQMLTDRAMAAVFPAPARATLTRSLDGHDSSGIAAALRAADLVDDAGAAVVSAGERGGFLPKALRLAADDIAERVIRRRRAVTALAYPAFLVVMASVILPLPLLVSKGAHAYATRALPGVIAIGAVALFALVIAPRLPSTVRASIGGVVAKVPLIGTIVVDTARASTLEVLGRLIAAGVPVTLALPTALAAGDLPAWNARSTHAAFSRSGSPPPILGAGPGVGGAARKIEAGATLAEALLDGGVVDEAIAGRIAVAERTGTLDTALPKLAEEARGRARSRFVMLSAAAGFACFVAIAIAIGLAAVSQTQGYFDAIDQATKE